MTNSDNISHLTDGRTSLVFRHGSPGGASGEGGGSGGASAMPELVYWGTALGEGPLDPGAFERPVVGGGLDVDPPVGLVAEAANGWFGRPGLEGHRAGGIDFAPRFALTALDQADNRSLVASLSDEAAGLGLTLRVGLADSGLVILNAELENRGDDDYHLGALRISLPVGREAGEALTLIGRHLFEFDQRRTPWDGNTITVENRHGKTSHERAGAVFVGTPGFGHEAGRVWAVHLGWSGNYELVCDAITDGRRVVSVGELLLSGEVVLGPGERYAAPTVYAAFSDDGLNEVSAGFHDHLRRRPHHPANPRPVHLNTWEAVYFDHDLDTLKALADAAAEVGVERFVLDDGWFGGRRDDRRGLGDWWVSGEVWPEGLDPIIDHVRALGMDFGIWFEPEMVNPDSDLYRTHPEWALVDARYEPVLGRHQLVLDLGRPEVRDHLFDRIDAVLSTYDIAYVKWDHNRDLVAPASGAGASGTGTGDIGGRAGVRAQTLGAYELFDRLRAAHPDVDIESCASGGGRVDFGILERTHRVWTSDSIDALDRQSIQAGFGLLFPPELMGSHIGAPVAHTTHRTHRLDFRAAAAVFGTLGIEWNLLTMEAGQRAEVATAIAWHKRHRDLLHTGRSFRVDHPDPTVAVHGVAAADGGAALVSVTRLRSGASHQSAPIRILGLEPDRVFRVALDHPVPSTHLGRARRQPTWLESGLTMTGRQLATVGFHPPQLDPETTLILAAAPTS